MNIRQRSPHQRRGFWLRRALLQLHLWTGLAIGLYIVMLSVTGSALVYRLELNRMFATPTPDFEPDREPLSREQLADAARRAYPGYLVSQVGARMTRHRPAIEVWLERGQERQERLFNPYTGEDLGDAMPRVMRALNWLALLHDDLLFGPAGRTINGIGSMLVALLVVTGAIVWWPGTRNWRRGLWVEWCAGSTSINSDLHRALGFWSSGLIAVWAVSGIYLALPAPFDVTVDYLSDPDAFSGERPADIVLKWITWLHFGRFSASLQIVWVVLGLVPAALFVTGGLMWWTRRFGEPDSRSFIHDDRLEPKKAPSWKGRVKTPVAGFLVVAVAAGLLYKFANYREEFRAQQFLDSVMAGQYDEAYAMWEDDGRYEMRRFLEEWGPDGHYTSGGRRDFEIVDSNAGGEEVTVYVRVGRATPVALRVDKETQLLSYAPYNKHAAVCVRETVVCVSESRADLKTVQELALPTPESCRVEARTLAAAASSAFHLC